MMIVPCAQSALCPNLSRCARRRLQKWFACVANAQFMLNDVQNESFAEQLREKTRYYREKDWPLDFFLVCDPAWLDEQHPQEAKKVQRPCVALVAAEESWARCASTSFLCTVWSAVAAAVADLCLVCRMYWACQSRSARSCGQVSALVRRICCACHQGPWAEAGQHVPYPKND